MNVKHPQFNTGIPYFDRLKAWNGKAEYKLEVPRALLAELGNPQDKIKTIHVAGTNGKGSVCCYIAAILQAAGEQKVAMHCSPHLTDVCERMIIAGRPVNKRRLIEASEVVERAADKLGIAPSFFEGTLACVFLIAAEQEVSWLVLETGLGGRLDATNLVKAPEAVVITNIGYDHTHILGNTLGEIAREKAGIVKPGAKVFVGEMPKVANWEVLAAAKKYSCEVFVQGDDFYFSESEVVLAEQDSVLPKQFFEKNSYSQAKRNNMLLAAKVAFELGFFEFIEFGLEKAVWPARFEVIERDSQTFILDVAHNPDGVGVLVSSLREYVAKNKKEDSSIAFVMSALERKDWKKMLEILSSEFPDYPFVFTRSSHFQAVDPEELREFVGSEASTVELSEIEKAVSEIDLIVLCGSIFLAGEVRPMLTKEPFSIFNES